MDLGMLLLWGVVGLLAGWLAGFVMKGGGYGLIGDMALGLVGSVVGGWIFRAVGASPEAGMVAVAVVAFIGAAILIVGQRKIWPATA
jgi:uncharacterized membrane protein YeaQ/YmgE (transglycosylase-associated protein family)